MKNLVYTSKHVFCSILSKSINGGWPIYSPVLFRISTAAYCSPNTVKMYLFFVKIGQVCWYGIVPF